MNSKQSVLGSQSERHAVTTASGYVAYESLSVLTYLRELLSDSNQMDKIVRSQPQILLARVGALRARVAFLRGLLRRAVEEQVRRTQALDEDRSSFQDFLTATVGDNADRNGPLYTKLQGAESKQSPLIRNFVYLDARSEGEEEQRMEQQYRAAEKSALLRLLLVYPAILSVEVRSGQDSAPSVTYISNHTYFGLCFCLFCKLDYSRMSAAYAAMLSVGLSSSEIEKAVMRTPRTLAVSPEAIRDCATFLRQNCGIAKVNRLLD